MVMKKVLLACSALIAALSFVSAAQAADMPASPSYNWTGLYFGANAGVSWNNSSLNNDVIADGLRYDELRNKIQGDQTAFTAGGLIGYNYQIDQIVLGAEADFNYLGFSDSNQRHVVYNDFPNGGDTIDVNAKSSLDMNWFGTIRGRLGYAIDNVLIYGTGGLAYGNVNASSKVDANYNSGEFSDSWKGSLDQTNWGWTVGGGIEYGVDNWSFGAEYLYVNLGNGDWNNNHNTLLEYKAGIKGNADFAFSTVRATIKYRFQ